jgi:hypothetical protein
VLLRKTLTVKFYLHGYQEYFGASSNSALMSKSGYTICNDNNRERISRWVKVMNSYYEFFNFIKESTNVFNKKITSAHEHRLVNT